MEPSTAMSFSGLNGGIIMSLISFSIVFLVCAGLMGLMMSLKYIVRVFEKKETPCRSNEAPLVNNPAGEAFLARETPNDEGELVAVITAAVTAAFGSSVRVTDIRPSNASFAPSPAAFSVWKAAARIENNKGI